MNHSGSGERLPRQGMRILCVDDEPAIRMTIEAYLSDMGHAVVTAVNGQEGLQRIAEGQFDCVLLDLSMPALSGLEVLRRTTAVRPNLPIVVVSGTGNIKEVIQALRLGAWDFITKPIEDMALLTHAVDRAVERARLITENQIHRERLEALVEERTRALSEEIAERKAMEGALRASLAEKEVLLKEVHHRVKNNLQIVSSLLSLQAVRYDGSLAAPFQDSQARVRAMALVHEKLYRSRDLSRIDFSAYLRQLADFLLQAYAPRSCAIRPDIASDDFFLSVDMAIPCGLVLNELVTNCLKHAFRDRAQGCLRIRARLSNGMARLEVEDDGRGLPEGFHVDDLESLGLQLVTNLCRQLKGTLTVSRLAPGTSFRLEFPLPEAAHAPYADDEAAGNF